MLLSSQNKILVLAPHTDDAEFGCGGTIAKLIENGNDVYSASFSACKQSVSPEFPEDILITEVKAASEVLGIKKENLILFDYEVRTFNYRRQEILDDLIRLRETINPDVVIMPSFKDIHQDHATIANEGIRAFKFCSILSYELPWNNLSFETTSFVILSEGQVNKKIEAIAQYKSQENRSYSKKEFIRSWALTRGVQIQKNYAECFEIVRWIL